MRFSIIFFISIFTFTVSCIIPSTPSQKILKPSSQNKQRVHLTKPKAYTGTVKIKVNTQLIDKRVSIPKIVDISAKILENTKKFKTQSLSTGNVIFQETFSNSNAKETQRNVTITDINKIYTLHIQNGDENSQSLTTSGSVNLNGTEVVTPSDFKGKKTLEITKSSLFLNTNNSLVVKINGKPGSSFTLTIYEDEVSGTIRRKNGIFKGHPNQAEHEKHNDKNTFDPTDDTSLGDLEPSAGDLFELNNYLSEPVSGVKLSFASSSNNEDNPVISLITGKVVVEFNNPSTDLQTFQDLYGATVESTLEVNGKTYYYMVLDLSKSPILNIQTLVQEYNLKSGADYQEFTFSSINAIKTFAIVFDSLINHKELIKSININGIPELGNISLNSVSQDNPPDDIEQLDDYVGGVSNPNADGHIGNQITNNNAYGKAWWLNDTRTPQAWNYSIGTGVKVAYLDIGYYNNGNLQDPKRVHREIDRRLITTNFSNLLNANAIIKKPDGSPDYTNIKFLNGSNTDETHGISTMLNGFAERDNGFGSSGIAPNALVMPFNVGSLFQKALGVREALINGADIIAIGNPVVQVDEWFMQEGFRIMESTWLRDFIEYALDNNIIVIVPANNRKDLALVRTNASETTLESFPGSEKVLRDKHMIVVCGVRPDVGRVLNNKNLATGSEDLIAWYDFGGNKGTSYDIVWPNKIVWAPSDRILKAQANDSEGKITTGSGNSEALPLVAATVALMKSRNPNMSPQEALNNLLNNSRLPVKPHPWMISDNISQPQKMMDVLGSVVNAIPNSTNFDEDNKVKEHPGIIQVEGAKRKLLMNNGKVKEFLLSLSNKRWSELSNGRKVNVVGWSKQNIKLGSQGSIGTISSSNGTEVLEAFKVKDLAFKPVIKDVKFFNKDSSGNYQPANSSNVRLTKDIRVDIIGSDMLSVNKKLKLRFIGPVNVTYEFDPQKDTINDFGTLAKFQLTTNRFGKDGSGIDKQLIPGLYTISIAGETESFSNEFTNSGDKYGIKSTVFASIPIGVQSDTYYVDPSRVLKEDQENVSGTLQDNYGVGVPFDKTDLRIALANQTTSVNGVEVTILDIVDDLVVFGLPQNGTISPGIYDIIIEAAGGNGISVEEAIQVLGEPTPNIPPGPITMAVRLNVFNVSPGDRARVYHDNQTVLAESTGNDSSTDISYAIGGTHDLRFMVWNNENTQVDGASWGFEVTANGQIVYRDIQGNAKSRVNASGQTVPPFGATGSQTGPVYDKTLKIRRDLNYSAINSYNVVITNGSETSEVLINGNQVMNQFGGNAVTSQVVNSSMSSGGNEFKFRVRKGPQNIQPLGNKYTWGFEIFLGTSLIYRNVNGTYGLFPSQPAGANYNDEALIGEKVMEDKIVIFK